MSVSGNNKIVLKAVYGDGGAQNEEGPLNTAATPGMNMQMSPAARTQERDSWGPAGTDFIGTGTGATTTKGPVIVLKEDPLSGGTITTPYVAGNNGFLHICVPGDVIQVLVASGQTVARGDGLSAASTGKWFNDATNAVVEALESSGGALAADNHMRVRVK